MKPILPPLIPEIDFKWPSLPKFPIALPPNPIADPFLKGSKPLIAAAILKGKKLGKDVADHAKKNLESREKERKIVAKALNDVIAEKRQRDDEGKPPPGLLADDDGDDPCPLDASGDKRRR